MERFTHLNRVVPRHSCNRFNAAPILSRFFLLLFFTFGIGLALNAQCSYSYQLETATGTPLLGTDAGDYSTPVFIDLDGDELEDLVSGGLDGTLRTWQRQIPATNPVFLEMTGPGLNPFDGIDVGDRSAPDFGDLDGDGDLDMVVGSSDGLFHYFRNEDGFWTELFGAENPFDTYDVGSNSIPALGDIDGDGDLDLLSGRSGGGIRLIENVGTFDNPIFDPPATLVILNVATGNYTAPTLADLDHDGDLDLLIGNQLGRLSYCSNVGGGLFNGNTNISGIDLAPVFNTIAPDPQAANNYSAPTFVDMDGDEDMDIVVGVFSGRFRFVRNTACATPPTLNGCTTPPNITVSLGPDGTYGLTVAATGISAPNSVCGGGPIQFLMSDLNSIDPPVTGTLVLDCMDVPSTSVLVIGTDPCNGRSATCTVNVTINDNIGPVARCVPFYDLPLNASGSASINVNNIDPESLNDGSLDNCSQALLGFDVSPFAPATFTCANIGVTGLTLTLTVTDNAGNSSTCTTQVRVRDLTPPTLPTLAPLTLDVCQTTSGLVNFTAPQYRPTVTDNCSVTATPSPTTASAWTTPGTYTLTWSYIDAGGNTATQTQTVNVVNNAAPVVTCPANILITNTNPGNPCGAVATWPTPTQNTTGCNSDINLATLASSHNSGATFPEGVTLVTYTVQDFSGNPGFCTFTVTVQEPPAVSGVPGTISVNAASGLCGANVNWTAPTFADDCSTPTVTTTHTPGAFFGIGTTTVQYTATDAKGNSTTATFNVVVTDSQFPVLSCPPNLTVNNQPGQCYANVLVSQPSASDNCPSSLSVTRTTPAMLPSQFPIGATVIAYSATDGTNTATCSYVITVRDNEKPVWVGSVCGSTVVLPPPPATSSSCTQSYSWNSPTVSDNCIGALSSYSVTITGAGATTSILTPFATSIPHSATFREGTSTVTYTAQDNAMPFNTGTCSFNVTVRNTTPPAISSCGSSSSASPVLVDVSSGQCSLLFTGSFSPVSGYGTLPINVAEGTDCDPGVLTYVFNSNNAALVPGVTVLPIGEHILRARATDVSGNTSTTSCLITLRVRETTLPTAAVCPANQVFNASSSNNTCGATITSLPQPSWTDNCASFATLSSFASVTYSPTVTNNFFPVGTTTAFFTTRDGAAPWGNVGFCTYTITVNDVTNPTLTCPASTTVSNDAGFCSKTFTWNNPAAVDNCGLTPISAPSFLPPTMLSVTGFSAGMTTSSATFPLGTTRVTYSVTDVNGRAGTCSFNVTVNDTQGPAFNNCPAPQVWNIATCSLSQGTATWATPTATDNCGGTVSVGAPNIASGTALPTGVHTVSYTATDQRGNSSICSFTITVREVTPPTFSNMPSPGICPPAVVTAGANCATLITAAMLTNPAATDNCPGTVTVSRISNLPTSPTSVETPIIVTWSATDVSGNSSQCSQTVTVRDQTAPTMNCHSSASAPLTVNASPTQPCLGISPNELFASPQWVAPTATDNCPGTLTPTLISNLPTYFPLGISQLTYRATDFSPASNSATCVVYLRVVESDIIPPSITCPNGVTVNANQGACFATNVNLGSPNASDTGGCTNSVSVTNNAPTQFPIGPTQVTWRATDGGGNSAVCVQTVTVNANAEICGNLLDDDCDGLVDEGCSGGGNTDPCQIQLLAADGAIRDSFAFSGNLTDEIAAIGAPADDNARGTNAGAVYLRYIDFGGAGVWGEFKKIIAGDGATSDMFGHSVDIDGDVLVVGAPQDDSKGSIYLYGRNVGGADNWGQIAKFSSPGALGDRFGHAVAIDGNYIVVGAPMRDLTSPARTDAGSAYVYYFNGANWVFLKEITSSDAVTGDRFGSSVDISGGNIIAGAPLADPGGIGSAGAAYVFRQDQGGANNWGQQKKLVATLDVAADEQFGYSVSIDGTNAVVGDYRDGYGALTRPGSVYLYSRDQGGANNWGMIKRITPYDANANDNFGFSVAVDGTDLLVGSRFDDDYGSNSGSAYHYSQNEGGTNNWGFIEKILAGDGVLNDNFGQFVAYSNGIYLIGSVRDDIGNSLDQGSAYMLTDCASNVQKVTPEDRGAATALASDDVRCFPNPFSDVINVDVNLQSDENLLVTVTDATGRQVATLFSGLATTENRYQWEAGSFNGGMYFIRVESESVRKVVPVVLIK